MSVQRTLNQTQDTYLNISIGRDVVILQRRHCSDSIRVSSSKLQAQAAIGIHSQRGGWPIGMDSFFSDSGMNANRTQPQVQGHGMEQRNANSS